MAHSSLTSSDRGMNLVFTSQGLREGNEIPLLYSLAGNEGSRLKEVQEVLQKAIMRV